MDTAHDTTPQAARLSFSRPADDTLRVTLSGSWRLQNELPPESEVHRQLSAPPGLRRLALW